jgi:hypothetical protein
VQLDTGSVGWLTLPGKRRRFRAWIFTAVRSRHRFVYPTFEETMARAIEACEAAWESFGGIFTALIPDNTKAIVIHADPLAARITPAFLEYAQARHFHIDPARVRHARDKGRVERAVPGVREGCFAGEVLTTLAEARARGQHWCLNEYGLRRHGRTQRRPLEHLQAEEQGLLRPTPSTRDDIPHSGAFEGRARSTRGRRQSALLDSASVRRPARHRARRRTDGSVLRARAPDQDASAQGRRWTVGRCRRLSRRAQRLCRANVEALRRQAEAASAVVGRYAAALLDSPLPWTRMRRVYALLALVRRYGAPRVTEVCTIALDADMLDIHRQKRILEHGRGDGRTPWGRLMWSAVPTIADGHHGACVQ